MQTRTNRTLRAVGASVILASLGAQLGCGKRNPYFETYGSPLASSQVPGVQGLVAPRIVEQSCTLYVPVNGSKPPDSYQVEVFRPAGTAAASSAPRTAVVTRTRHPALVPPSTDSWTIENVRRTDQPDANGGPFSGSIWYDLAAPIAGLKYQFFLWVELPSRFDPVTFYGVFALEQMLDQKIELSCQRFYGPTGEPLTSG